MLKFLYVFYIAISVPVFAVRRGRGFKTFTNQSYHKHE